METGTEIQEYFNQKKEIYKYLISFLEKQEITEDYYDHFFSYIKDQQIQDDHEEFEHFLCLIANLCNNHNRKAEFIEKIKRILLFLKEKMKQMFSNYEIIDIFIECKLILLFLFENKIITYDENINNQILYKTERNGMKYSDFFRPEIKSFSPETEIQILDSSTQENYEEKRHNGENEMYICLLIRQDLINEFIVYVNRNNIPLSSTIKPSIFETNSFLNENELTLIEYAAFFGSIQIFQYLRFNQVEMKSILWFCVIHSNNEELIHLLNDNEIQPPNDSYFLCFEESIKCHHNEIANYIEENYMTIHEFNDDEHLIEEAFQCFNYLYFPNEINKQHIFRHLCEYNYIKAVHNLLKMKMKYIEAFKINVFFFLIKFMMFALFEFNNKSIQQAAEENQIEIIYHLLLKESQISARCFLKCENLFQISIPSSITSIGKYAFKECKSLLQIKIPPSVTLIEDFAFSECTSLNKITFPTSSISIGKGAFYGCSSLKQISIRSPKISIGNFAFDECLSLEKVIITSPDVFIGSNAFKRCSNLSEFSCFSLASIGNNVFRDCVSLKRINIPSSVMSIGENSFKDCKSLVNIELPSSLLSIGYGVFSGCTSLKQISLPSSSSSLQKIGNYAFYKCISLTQIFIPSSITSIGNYVFSGCVSLERVSIPSSVTSIECGAFEDCCSLKEVPIHSTTKIAEKAFPTNTRITEI